MTCDRFLANFSKVFVDSKVLSDSCVNGSYSNLHSQKDQQSIMTTCGSIHAIV